MLMLCFIGVFAQIAQANARLTIYTVNYPLQYFAQRIAGEKAEVVFPAPKNIDPAFWSPDAKTIHAYQTADLILLNGANYAKWINKISLPRLRMVNTSRAFEKKYIQVQSGVTHSHGAGPDHSHTGIAFTTWLDMSLAIQQAEAIKNALIKKQPKFEAEFITNFKNLKNDLLMLDTELKKITKKNMNLNLFSSHPVYQYLANRYELNLQSVVWEPDVLPGPEEWKIFERKLQAHPATWMIWEAPPKNETLMWLRKVGINSLIFNPCANVPEAGDFLTVMHSNISELKRAY